MYLPISSYAAIGNLRTVALVGRNGSIDWCCFPHMDDGSVFAAILDHRRGGRFRVAPPNAGEGTQRYLDDTNVLETAFETDGGRLTVTDFMPLRGDLDHCGGSQTSAEIVRVVNAQGSDVEVELEWSPRLDYARTTTDVRPGRKGWLAEAGGERLVLGGVPDGAAEIVDIGGGPGVRGRFTLRGGDQVVLVTRWDSDEADSDPRACRDALQETKRVWESWAHKDKALAARDWAGPWYESVMRSSLALKLLTHCDTGAIAAAATTSLPEEIGGVRNWDYRFTWIRDAGLTAQALVSLGHRSEAAAFLQWAERVSARKEREGWGIQIMYGLHGEDDSPEQELTHLEGYRQSRPVRIGNGAFKQTQHDVYGELLNAAFELVRLGESLDDEVRSFLVHAADRACEVWKETDYGIWEVRSEAVHFVYSKVMVWVALDRAIWLSENARLKGDVDRWRKQRAEVRREILEKGYNREVGAFVQSYGEPALDASNLLIPMLEFLPIDDPRVQGTIDRTKEQLTENGLVYRYRWEDGLEGEEGAFCLTTFWLVDVLALSGRLDEAWDLFEGLARRTNHVGLFSEQIDPRTGEFLGNFPQAFSHIGLIDSTLQLAYAEGKPLPIPAPVGTPQHRS